MKKNRADGEIRRIRITVAFVAAAVLMVTALIVFVIFGSAGVEIMVSDTKESEAAKTVANPKGDRNVILCMGEKKNTAYISWSGDKGGPEFLRFSKDKYSLPVSAPLKAQRNKVLRGNAFRFKVELTGLEEGETYYYEIGDGVSYESPRFFSVPSDDGEDVFVYLGDPQFDKSINDYVAWGRLTKEMYERNPDVEFAVLGGDLVNLPGRKDHWQGFLNNCTLFSSVPMMVVPGNHEGVTSNNTYKKLFHNIDNGVEGGAFYWFETEQCRFIMLDSSFLTEGRRLSMGSAAWSVKESEIRKWMGKALSESNKRWNIVVTHHPVYGVHDMFTVSKELRRRWLPIMTAGNVDLVLCGHQHVYMRTRDIDGTVHVMGVSGAKRSNYYMGNNEPEYSSAIYASGPNYQIIRAVEDRLEIKSYNEKGSIIDAACIYKDTRFPYFRTFW